jgi:hypothetical protein
MQYLCFARADYSDVLRCGKKELRCNRCRRFGSEF